MKPILIIASMLLFPTDREVNNNVNMVEHVHRHTELVQRIPSRNKKLIQLMI
jgi:hypothetical protein